MQNVAAFNTGTTKVATDIGWSYAPGRHTVPTLPAIRVRFSPLAQQELKDNDGFDSTGQYHH